MIHMYSILPGKWFFSDASLLKFWTKSNGSMYKMMGVNIYTSYFRKNSSTCTAIAQLTAYAVCNIVLDHYINSMALESQSGLKLSQQCWVFTASFAIVLSTLSSRHGLTFIRYNLSTVHHATMCNTPMWSSWCFHVNVFIQTVRKCFLRRLNWDYIERMWD